MPRSTPKTKPIAVVDPIGAAIDRRIDAKLATIGATGSPIPWITWVLLGFKGPQAARRWAAREGVRVAKAGRTLLLDRAAALAAIERTAVDAPSETSSTNAANDAPIDPVVAQAFGGRR